VSVARLKVVKDPAAIADDDDGRITRIRVTTWPDWSAVDAFEDYD
jgi:hypothetical protein